MTSEREVSAMSTHRFEHPRRFRTTRWSLVLAARGEMDSEASKRAFGELYRLYWYPVYAFMRQRCKPPCSPELAADLTQELFAEVLARGDLRGLDEREGRFRSWLMRVASNLRSNDLRRVRAQKRDIRLEDSFDVVAAEERYAGDVGQSATQEQLFDRRFALCLLTDCIDSLQNEYVARGKGALFERIVCFLPGSRGDDPRHDDLAASLGITTNNLKQIIFRMRQRHREIFYSKVRHTVDDPKDTEAEVRAILEAISIAGDA